jgi:superfamily I DNA/RNA helicase
VANRLISNNPRRRKKNLWSPKQGGEPVRVISVPDDRKEAEFIIQEVAAHRAEQRLPWEHFAAIYRMNAQSNPHAFGSTSLAAIPRIFSRRSWRNVAIWMI